LKIRVVPPQERKNTSLFGVVQGKGSRVESSINSICTQKRRKKNTTNKKKKKKKTKKQKPKKKKRQNFNDPPWKSCTSQL